MASYDGYLCLGGIEIVNKGRLSQMIGIGRGPEGIMCKDCAPCPEMDEALGYVGGYNPAENPWYDPNIPDSDDFAGLLVTSITGLEPGNTFSTTPITENATVGATLKRRAHRAAPQIVVTGLLMARTCAGMEYGYAWLRSAVRGSCTPTNFCSGDDLTFIVGPPNFPDEDCGPVDFPAELVPYLRTFKGAAIVDGPKITSIVPRGCPSCYECGMLEVQFTLSAADPCIYHEPIDLGGASFVLIEDSDCIEWIFDPDGTEDCSDDCPPAPNCAVDPRCVDLAPPAMPTIVSSCVNDCISGDQFRACLTIPGGTFPSNTEGTVVLTINSGDLPLTNIEVDVWENPIDLDPAQLEDCAKCASLAISYVAANSSLVIDGTQRTSTINCPLGTSVRANPYIANTNGTINFTYPLFDCAGDYTICIRARGPIADNASVDVVAVAREC